MMQSPLDKFIVEIDKKYEDEISHGTLRLYLDTSFQPEWHATIRGKVKSLPRKISKDPFKKVIVPEVQEGDEILFSYLVVFDRDFISNPEEFYPVDAGEFKNGLKRTIKVMNLGNKLWAAVLFGKDGDWIDGRQGNESEIGRWMSQFKFKSEDDMIYCNMILADKEYWQVDVAWTFARKVEDGWQMVGGYVMLEPIEEEVESKGGLVLPEYLKKRVSQTTARIVSIGTPTKDQPDLKLQKGDVVFIDYSRCEKYQIDGKNMLITTQKRLLGK